MNRKWCKNKECHIELLTTIDRRVGLCEEHELA